MGHHDHDKHGKSFSNLRFFSILASLLLFVLVLSMLVSMNRIFPIPDVILQSFNFSQQGKLVFDDSFRGTNPGSNLTMAIFSDFKCPSCLEQHSDIERLVMNYSQVNFLFKYLPSDDSAASIFEIASFECAKNYGFALDMHSFLFTQEHTGYDIIKFAESLGIERSFFDNCTNSSMIGRMIQGDALQAQMLGVRGTPTVFLNGIKIEGAHSYDVYARLIESELSSGGKAR